jgi:NitT/TauT family transport system substrate-binding protein
MMRRLLYAFTALLVLGVTSPEPTTAQTNGLTTVRVVSAISDDLRPLLYAQKAGLFRRVGLNVVLQLSNSGALAAQAILAGGMDIGKSSLSSIIAAHARGLPFVLVAPSAVHRAAVPNSAIIVAANSRIRSPLDLQGKTVACTSIGAIGYLGFRALIDASGGNSATLRWVEIPTSAIASAIEQGRVDAGITTEPYMTKDLQTGKVRFLVDVLAGYRQPILESAYYATREYVESHADVVKRFAKVMGEATAYSNAHVAETVALYAALAGMEPSVAAQMHATYSATEFDARQIQPIIDLSAKYKMIPHAFDASELLKGGGLG